MQKTCYLLYIYMDLFVVVCDLECTECLFVIVSGTLSSKCWKSVSLGTHLYIWKYSEYIQFICTVHVTKVKFNLALNNYFFVGYQS